ncbi:L-aspartate oxidase [Endozoicomonas sp. Mp262]|uniref:L-aspartate oxidase n=1 Tax=Endozoicomonas sp. Mp262 TaxID=2919499 RepID=UPI0021D7FD3A
MQKSYLYDVVIIGSGAAGLTLALHLPSRYRIALLSKDSLSAGSTYGAQGGVAAVLNEIEDSFEQHTEDTLIAGAGLCKKQAVDYIVKNGQESIHWLIDQGVPFTANKQATSSEKEYHLTKEGGHSARRIIHAADATGKAISDTLVQSVRKQHNIDIYEHHIAIDLITSGKFGVSNNSCLGAYALDCKTGNIHNFLSGDTILASGGASKAYLYTSNTDGATGDGIAMAWRAGCRVANMEFNQFHPTCLYHPNAKSFLISEAVRGEGGRLLLPNGQRFMPSFDQRAELAPRDIVARAIDHEMKRLGADCLFLDISHKPDSFIKSHFPTIFERCLSFGIDISREPIPIVPAAHYTCGGIVTQCNGATDLNNLFAVGECAFTGLHGANRLASNSLLECLVMAQSAAKTIERQPGSLSQAPSIPQWDESRVTDSDEDVVISHNWDELRRFMWNYVGIVRTDKRLQRALNRITLLQAEIHEFYSNYKVSSDLIELRNLAKVSELIIRCAMSRKESRGLHYSLDYPYCNKQAEDSILVPEPIKRFSDG